MKNHKRSWHFYLLVVSFSIFWIAYLLWKFSPLKNEVEAVLIERLQPYLGESFLINGFDIGFNSISFYEVSAADNQSTFAVDFEEIRIGFNLLKLFSYDFKPLKIIESVTIANPSLSLYYQERKNREINPDISLERVFEEIVVNLQKFPEIDHIAIVNGKIYLQVLGGKQLPVLSNLEGRINFVPNSKEISLDLRGKFLAAADSSINLIGKIDFDRKVLAADLILNECTINSNWPFWKLDFFQLENARLRGAVHLSNSHFTSDSLFLEGAIRVNDLKAKFFNQQTSASRFNILFKKRHLEVEPVELAVEDGRAIFRGSIADIFYPKVEWQLDFENYSAKYLRQSHHIFDYAYEGKIAGQATFSGPINAIQINATLYSPNILYAVIPLNTVNIRLGYNTAEKILEFNAIRADFLKFRTRGTGQVDLNVGSVDLFLKSDIDVPEGYFSILNGLNTGAIHLYTTFKGSYRTKLFGGNFRYTVHGADSLLVRGEGPFRLNDQLFDFRLSSRNLAVPFTVSGRIENLFSHPDFNTLDIKSFPVEQFTANPLIASAVRNKHVDFYFAGPYNSLRSKMKLVSRDRMENLLILSANIRDIFMEDQRFIGEFSAYTAPQQIHGNFEVAFSEAGITTEIHNPDLFTGKLFIGSTPDSPFSGKVYVQHFSISDYLANSPAMAKNFQEGFLEGEVVIAGTVQRPFVSFNLDAQDCIVNEVGYYSAKLSGKLTEYILNFDNFWVRLNGERVFNADCHWNLFTDTLGLTIKARGVESNFLAETIFKDRDIIKGRFTYEVVASGQSASPDVKGLVKVENGDIKNIPFHSINIAFEDSTIAGTDFWNLNNHLVKISGFVYESKENYTAEGNGMISIDENGPLDINITVRGNVLAELPRINPFFKHPQSNGNLYVHVLGSQANPYFDEVQLTILDGSLEFEEVIPAIRNLKARIELANDSNFVHIKFIEGYLNNRWAKIYNVPRVETKQFELSPWMFEDIGLNFGIFILETDEHGIPLSIPGLMVADDIGYFATSGRQAGEKFYIAGPAELPITRGIITLYNCRVTFPFIGMYEDGEYNYDEDNRVIDFLMNMRWEVLAKPGYNNRYFVNVPAYVGEVKMSLNIDNTSPGLDFTGRLADESFRVEGAVESVRGQVEYLDANFKVERFGAEFNRFEIFPEVYGRAYTTVRDTTRNFPKEIYLELYVVDPVTKKEISKGRWEDFRFKLVSPDNGLIRNQFMEESQEQILASLGYSVHNLRYKAGEVGLSMTENYLIRPLFRPLERKLEQGLRLDYVRLRSSFTTNLLYLSLQSRTRVLTSPYYYYNSITNNLDPGLLLLQSSELTLGKYFLREFYMSYSGKLVPGYESSHLGVNHSFNIEYRLFYNLLLEIGYDKFFFNPFYSRNINSDFRIRIRHSFNF